MPAGTTCPVQEPSTPLTLYLYKLLEPDAQLQEPILVPPVLEPSDGTAHPPQVEKTPLRAYGSTVETSRTVSPARQTGEEKASQRRVATRAAGSPTRAARRPRPTAQGAGGIRQKAVVALIPVLAVILISLLKNPLAPPATTQAQTPPRNAMVVQRDSNIEIPWQIPPLYEPGGRDPMRLPPLPAEATAESTHGPRHTYVDLAVMGILYSEDRPAAIVDTKLVREGQQVSGTTVKRIDADSVEFEMNGRTWKQTVDRR